jgi:putative oxidoreductase
MALAGFVIHGDDPFSKMELSLMFLAMYITIFITGAGKYSLDYLIRK